MLISNTLLITWEATNRILDGHAIVIKDGRTKDIGTNEVANVV